MNRHWMIGERLVASLLVVTIVSWTSGCAQIFRGGHADVSFTTNPGGADVRLDGQQCATPCRLSLSRSSNHVVTIGKAGHRPATLTVSSSVSVGWVIADLILWGLIVGPLVDERTASRCSP